MTRGLFFVIRHEQKLERIHPVETSATTVGRDQSNVLCLADRAVSRNHAVLVQTPTEFVIRDLNSRNGTLVNGRRITNTSAYPWRAHASLLITAADNSMWIGTGWFIGPHTLITAGHVVHIKNSGVPGRDGWVKKIVVMPGRNGSSMPYGSVTSNNFRAVSGWTASGNENYDYGAIIIPNELGNTVGTFGFGIYSDADLLASVGNISGYPGDKPTGTQWYASRKIASVNPFKVYYDIDTAGGQSGAAVYRTINGARYSVAIHAYGGATTNSGTRIIKPVYDNMVLWKA